MAERHSSSGVTLDGALARAPRGRIKEVDCPEPPACPACGGLECLCRPHFFAGQLLTEDDLNRLERYVVAKNKLHNRHLHGWGVVCGLEVVCGPCGDGVLVRPGHALAPCGDDIVVCKEEPVDVCALIEACRPGDDHGCQPSSMSGVTPREPRAPSDACKDAVERWVLAICYEERPSRGVTPLRQPAERCSCGAGASSAHCACGGRRSSGSCGCGGNTKAGCQCGAGTKSRKASGGQGARPGTAPACEPTLICEGYRFIAYKAPTRDPISVGQPAGSGLVKGSTADRGPLIERVLCCWQALVERIDRLPARGTRAELHRWCCETRATLIEFVSEYPTYDCGIAAKASALVCPEPGSFQSDAAYRQALVSVAVSMAEIAAEYLRYCLCRSLLPPCPPPAECNCVPLAMIEVKRSPDCKIVSVCNWGPRKIALTFPQFQYWLSPFRLGEALTRALERLCCTPLQRQRAVKYPAETSGPLLSRAPTAAEVPAESASTSAATSRILVESFRNQARTLDAATLLLDALGFVDDKDAPLLSTFERSEPVSLLLANQVVRPFVSSLLPERQGPDLSDLRRQVEELRRVVDNQANELKDLRTRRPRET